MFSLTFQHSIEHLLRRHREVWNEAAVVRLNPRAQQEAKLAKVARSCVIGPDGKPLTLREMPSPETQRWNNRKKAKVVVAVDSGLLDLADACNMYALSLNEFLSWKAAYGRFGLAGLRATHAQDYRHPDFGHSHR